MFGESSYELMGVKCCNLEILGEWISVALGVASRVTFPSTIYAERHGPEGFSLLELSTPHLIIGGSWQVPDPGHLGCAALNAYTDLGRERSFHRCRRHVSSVGLMNFVGSYLVSGHHHRLRHDGTSES